MVLVMTVLVLSILLVLGYAFSYSAAVNLSAARNARAALQRECEMESALNYALAVLQADGKEGAFDTLDEAWSKDDLHIEVANNLYVVRIVDENRKLNLNRAVLPPGDAEGMIDLRDVLKRLLHSAGGRDRDFEALVAWVDPSRPLPLIAGLNRVPNLDPQLLQPRENEPPLDVLLATHPAQININTASEALLDALWADADITRAVLERRTREPFRSRSQIRPLLQEFTDSEPILKSDSFLDVQSDFFTVSVLPAAEVGHERLTALVKRTGDTVQVLNVLRNIAEGSQ